MSAPLRILILEDSAADAELIERALRRSGLEIAAQRVQTEGALRVALAEIRPCVVLMDYNVPGFRGDAALAVAHALAPGLPVIFVSGTIGEELAVELVKSGATDYVLKDRLERLPLAVRRALDDADQRAARQRAEEAERRGAETLSIALEAAQMGTWDWNIATGELAWSDRCKAIFGIAADEPMNYGRFLRALHPDDRSAADTAITHALATQAPYDIEFRAVWPDSTVHWVASKGRAFSDAAGHPTRMAGTAMCITARKQAEEERQRVEAKLQETQKLESLGVLAGGIAHDFNNLLTGVIGNATLALFDLPKGSPLLPCLEQIEEAAQRAAGLCKQMLAYAGKGRFIVHDLDLSELVQDTAHLLASAIGKGVTLDFHLAENLPAVSADAAQLRQIVMNLVLNASEAIGERTGVIRISTGRAQPDHPGLSGVLERPAGGYVYLQIADSGSGMTEETAGKIFDPFFTTKFTGRGLGLAAVQGIVRSHHGILQVASEPEHGATFEILFPTTGHRPKPPASPAQEDPLWRGTGTVLVVDDERAMRVTAARMLEAIGFRVLIAEHGVEAVEILRANPEKIHGVLLDLTMPKLDGEGTFRALRQLRPDLRVVLMSGYNEADAIRKFIGQGLTGFLQKPFSLAALRARMKETLG